MFINLTNHPSSGWSKEQLEAAQKYGEIVDLPFPNVDEQATETEINNLADDYLAIIKKKGKVQELTVHIMGEQTFCYALISKLQKEGIRCIASCTKHDTFINEQGQKVSTFHFTRFREFVPPRALRWWKNVITHIRSFCQNLSPNLFKRKYFYCWSALILVTVFEILVITFLQTAWVSVKLISIVVGCLLLFLFLTGRALRLNFNIRSAIVTKLLANAIVPTRLGTLYLLSFVIHIGWLTNAVLGLFTENGNSFCHVLLATVICILGIITLILFFPNVKDTKSSKPNKVFISGISAINFNIHNLNPLVRILQLTDNNDSRCELFILNTNYYSQSNAQAKIKTNYNQYFEESLRKIENEQLRNDYAKAEGSMTEIEDKLGLLIKMEAINMFPEKTWIPQGLNIIFSKEETDYNAFDSCYVILDRYVREKENKNNLLFFNLTPGTGIIGALMTLMAIDGDRSLYYYSQDESIPDNERLKVVDKSQIPLRRLLSQALDSVEDNNK